MFEKEVKELAEKRGEVALLNAAVENLRREWEAKYKDLLAEFDAARKGLDEADAILREKVVEHFHETGEKKPHPKLGVRVSHYVVYDEDEAMEFARANIPALLILDKRGFEAYVKGVAGISRIIGGQLGDIIEFREKVTATISKDLEG